MSAGLEVGRPPNQQELPVGGVLGARPEGFGAGDHEQPGGHDRPLPKAAELLQRVQRQHVDALRLGGHHRGSNQLRSGPHIGIDEAEPVAFGQQRAAPACMRLAEPALRQHPRASQPDPRIASDTPFHRCRRAVLRFIIDNNDRRAAAEADLRRQPFETSVDVLDLVPDRHDDRDWSQQRKPARRRKSGLPIGAELPQDAGQQIEHQGSPGRPGKQDGHQARRRRAVPIAI